MLNPKKDDYINWINSRARQDNFIMLAKNLKKISIKKENLELDLVELEAAAKLVLEEASDVSGIFHFNPRIQFLTFFSPLKNVPNKVKKGAHI